VGQYLAEQCKQLPLVKEIRGKGLMIGIEFNFPIKELREKLVYEHHIFVGNSNQPNTLRLLPSLTITKAEVDLLMNAIKASL
jgi:acetylornithine aminotransferase